MLKYTLSFRGPNSDKEALKIQHATLLTTYKKAYQTLVCPQIEYASEVWNFNTATKINRLEQIQRNAALFGFLTTEKKPMSLLSLTN